MRSPLDAAAETGGVENMLDVKVEPTPGESLLTWRRRLGCTQGEAASYYAVSEETYRAWEMDRRKEDQPKKDVADLAAHEACFLLRRRMKKTQQEVAAALGVSRLWVVQMESGEAPVEQLAKYWGVKHG